MDPQKVERTMRDAKWLPIVLLVLNLILLFFQIKSGVQISSFFIITKCVVFALCIATFIGYSNKKMYGPICGIIVSILIILSLDIISIVIGIAYLIENISLIKYIKD